jgi:ankyrin repeat protein
VVFEGSYAQGDFGGQPFCRSTVAAENLKVVRLFLAIGADVDERDNQGLTPLAHAVLENREVVVELLMEKGANTDVLSEIGSKRDLRGRIHKAILAGNENVVSLRRSVSNFLCRI